MNLLPPPAPAPAPSTALAKMTPAHLRPPAPPMPRMSPSQLDTFSMCPRKWGWQYLDGIKSPQHPSAQCGEHVHTILENWLRGTASPDYNATHKIGDRVYEVGKIAMSGIHNLPPPGPHLDIEVAFEVPFLTGVPVLWRGKIDVAFERYEVILTLPTGESVLSSMPTPEILDHKTTSNLGYRKLPDDLLEDVQALVYAYAAMVKTGTRRVNLRWVYYKTSKPYKSEVSFTTMTFEHVAKRLALFEMLAFEGPIRAKKLKLNALQMQPNPRACDRFGGCYFKDRCKLTPVERMRATMSAENDLMSKIHAVQQMTGAGQVPPAPPPPMQGMAPMFGNGNGHPAPAPGMPLPQYAPPGYAQGYVHPTPTVVQPPPQQYAATPPTYAAQPAGWAPAPPTPPAPPAPQHPPTLPAPWRAHPNDPAWLWNPENNAMEPNTAEGWAKVAASAAPPTPPAPPAPPAAPALPQAALIEAPLSPEERYAITDAIQKGATDAQILAYYPRAVNAVAALRLELQGPQRATTINAPESNGVPQLAQPPAAPAPAAPAAPRSVTAEELDKMDVKEMKNLAKTLGVDVKGMREANTRIELKKHLGMHAGTVTPAAPAQQQPSAMTPATLQMPPGAAPPAPPQQYSTAPTIPGATKPNLGAIAPHAANGPPNMQELVRVADEVRGMLDLLNKIGDKLRALIGAD